MTIQRRQLIQGAALGLAGMGLPAAFASTESFPTKPIRVTVPYPAGGLTDTVARHVANGASEILKQPVVVENRPGVGGNLGAELVAKSPADGYNLCLMLSGSLAVGAAAYTKLKYNPESDLICVTELYKSNAMLAVNAALPIKNMQDLVAYAKANPDKLSIASWGQASAAHATQHLLAKNYGAKMLHVPYKGEAQIMTDLIGGQVDLGLVSSMSLAPHAKAGKLRAISVMGASRSTVFPDVATLNEQGFKDEYWAMDGPTAVFAPKDTKPEIIAVLNKAFAEAAKMPKMQEFAKEVSITLAGNTQAEAQAHFKRYFTAIKTTVGGMGVTLD